MTDGKQEKREKKSQIGRFILKTLFYFAIIFILIYLYEYSGVNGGHFIYNEF
ncbi:teichoic acid D-Ala incorporation-associated protein DltX [Lapidilactobacillus gannanensis]|jgi:hypothetical protein|uniref:Teichoic acid D-Ala incorporation-associated protein DltX n=1 Tax=Lapidilactobacillus gannanensis TaxID=2486002 RepID=A0ABW4BJW3_9LACO|nr:teichoic acid D-Ala incorporation-associated protein DltX [Lapidilactobacillus gannanensis]MCH4057889.1 teichoic acid D-Ala incorporation-associated protein DltX [Lactobacillaceae bacterium]